MVTEIHSRELILVASARIFLLALLCISLPHVVSAQTGNSGQVQSGTQSTGTAGQAQPKTAAPTPEEPVETLKIETDLVTVPVVVTDRNGVYIPDLVKNDFSISEDGVQQQISFFATITVPFHVVLMLDTSASTQDKIGLIQQAAIAFVEQLQPKDRVKVISFDDQVTDLNVFTNDRSRLKTAIYRIRSGQGTKLYDAFSLALSSLSRIEGRKAIVIFTDGVDYHSDYATFDRNLRGLDEEGVLVYPIRYDTREAAERIARQQSDQGPLLPTLDVIRKPTPGTTAPTFPSDDPSPVPNSDARNRTGPLGLPTPDEILRRRRDDERTRGQDRDRLPTNGLPPPSDGRQGRTDPNGPWPDRRNEPGNTSGRAPDSTGMLLDHL
jgi:Mg-chelatase subunit ChlD